MNLKKDILVLADKAQRTHDSADALRFSQAAVNLMNVWANYECTAAVGFEESKKD